MTTLTPLAEYLATDYSPDREYIDGVVEERNLGEYDHGRLEAVVAGWLYLRRREWNIRVLIALRVQVSPTRIRVPDVTILDRSQPVKQIITHPPLVVIEILSPEDTWAGMEDRIADYLRFGIGNVWIVDPGTRRGWVVTPDGRRGLTRTFTVSGWPIEVSLDELFREVE